MTSLLTILHKLARISYNFHTKLEIHKVVFLVLLCIFLSKNLYSYAENTEEFKNGIFLHVFRFGDVMPGVTYSRYVKVTSIFEFSALKLPCMQIFMCFSIYISGIIKKIFLPVFEFGDMPVSKTGTSAFFIKDLIPFLNSSVFLHNCTSF